MSYDIVEALPGGRSQLARDAGGRLVVLKPLPADCLYLGELRPHVKERLARVREVADLDVANLHGVELFPDGMARLVWDYVGGTDLPSTADLQLVPLARSLVLAVEKLHLLGLVHGALHLRNVIVGAEGRVVLTHVSPLVLDDPRKDAADIAVLLRSLNSRPGVVPIPELAKILADLGPTPELPMLRERLLLAEAVPAVEVAGVHPEHAPRSGWIAASLVFAGLGISALVLWFALGGLR